MASKDALMPLTYLRDDFFAQFWRYWPKNQDLARAVSQTRMETYGPEPLPPRLEMVELPPWAQDLGIAGKIAIPAHLKPDGNDWRIIDWPLVGAWFLHCLAERAHEQLHGPIHSNAWRLKGWSPLLWRYAWANRIALFLRRWAAVASGRDEDTVFGPLPETKILLTHDVDAVSKTWPIRLKQSAFHIFNALRLLRRGQGKQALQRLNAWRAFMLRGSQDWGLEKMAALDAEHELAAYFLFAGARAPGLFTEPRRWLLDPGYDSVELAPTLQKLLAEGHTIGLHPSYEHWRDAQALEDAKKYLETALGGEKVRCCRQHWLRFSFAHTWAAQHEAGFTNDFTLGFNNRPGFRNGAALAITPFAGSQPMRRLEGLAAWPLVLMDSQLYDYDLEAGQLQNFSVIDEIMGEVNAVRGQATVLWHPHTLSCDYGWEAGCLALLRALKSFRAENPAHDQI